MSGDSDGVSDLCRNAARRIASRLHTTHLGDEVDGDYTRRFARLRDELRRDFGVDCSYLYGTALGEMRAALAALIADRLDAQAQRAGPAAFSQVARLLYLQICGDLWGSHIANLRDLMAVELLSYRGHKSAVAAYVRRCADAWQALWESVEGEFLSRLLALPLSASSDSGPAQVVASGETERLLEQRNATRGGHLPP